MANSLFDDGDQQVKPGPANDLGLSIAPGPDAWDAENAVSEKPENFVISEAPPETLAETTRKSGLAWSAGIVFFGSVAFMLVLGWFADLLLGSSPWGLVGGIVLGSIIGFIQFFRITSQIFGAPKTEMPKRTLLSDENDDE